jgi:hypothetical protein
MSVQSDFKTLMAADIVGTRVYPNSAPDSPVKPYIVYSRLSSQEQNTLEGTGVLTQTRMQVDVWADTYGEAQAKAGLVKARMKTWATKNIKVDEQDFYESDTKLHRVMLDYSIWHQ